MAKIAEQRHRVERFRSAFGDERAFRVWYDDALPRVFGYLYRRCGGDRALAEELTQRRSSRRCGIEPRSTAAQTM